MINIYVNNEMIQIENNVCLMDFLSKNNYLNNYYAIALNKRFVAKNQYQACLLKEGDSIHIVTPMQGG